MDAIEKSDKGLRLGGSRADKSRGVRDEDSWVRLGEESTHF